jgi:hypothetical protein
MAELAALHIRPSPFDPVGVLPTAAQLRGQQTQEELVRLRMAEMQEEMRENRDRRGALSAFRTAGGMANPTALSTLSGHPDIYQQALQGITARDAANLMRNARGAQRVMGFRPGSPERLAAYREELDNALAEGRIDPRMHAHYSSQQPTSLLLNNIISQARALPDSAWDGLEDMPLGSPGHPIPGAGQPGPRASPFPLTPQPGMEVISPSATDVTVPGTSVVGPQAAAPSDGGTGLSGFTRQAQQLPGAPPAAAPSPPTAPPAAPAAPPAAAQAEPRTINEILQRGNATQRAVWALARAKKDTDAMTKVLQEIMGGTPMTARQTAETEEGLRREFATLAKPYFETRDAFARVESATRNPSPAGDLALIFNFMKMLDPGSVVREGEFATAQNTAGVPDRVRNLYNRLLSGERLNPEQREDFLGQSRGLMETSERQYTAIQGQYRGIAQRMGLNPQNTILDFTRPPASAAPGGAGGGPQAGPVRITGDADYARLPSGTRFIGPDGVERTKP